MNAIQGLRSAGRSALDLGERILHPLRRVRARRRLAGELATGPDEILFVCHGNICRSPFAERLFRKTGGFHAELDVRSSGFYPEADRRSPEEAVAAARRRGVALDDHRSRVVDDDALRRLGRGHRLVFVMTPRQGSRLRRAPEASPSAIFVLGDFDPDPVPHRRIEDPWGQGAEAFDRIFGRIERCVRQLGELAAGHLPLSS